MTDDTDTLSTDFGQLRVPERASPAEVAAIAAAIGAHVRDQRLAAATATDDEEQTWDGERFAFAGRLEGLTGAAIRVPRTAPTDKWTATGRRDRYDR